MGARKARRTRAKKNRKRVTSGVIRIEEARFAGATALSQPHRAAGSSAPDSEEAESDDAEALAEVIPLRRPSARAKKSPSRTAGTSLDAPRSKDESDTTETMQVARGAEVAPGAEVPAGGESAPAAEAINSAIPAESPVGLDRTTIEADPGGDILEADAVGAILDSELAPMKDGALDPPAGVPVIEVELLDLLVDDWDPGPDSGITRRPTKRVPPPPPRRPSTSHAPLGALFISGLPRPPARSNGAERIDLDSVLSGLHRGERGSGLDPFPAVPGLPAAAFTACGSVPPGLTRSRSRATPVYAIAVSLAVVLAFAASYLVR